MSKITYFVKSYNFSIKTFSSLCFWTLLAFIFYIELDYSIYFSISHEKSVAGLK